MGASPDLFLFLSHHLHSLFSMLNSPSHFLQGWSSKSLNPLPLPIQKTSWLKLHSSRILISKHGGFKEKQGNIFVHLHCGSDPGCLGVLCGRVLYRGFWMEDIFVEGTTVVKIAFGSCGVARWCIVRNGWVGIDYTCSAPHPPSASLMFCGGSIDGMNSRTTYATPVSPIILPAM